MYGQSQSLLLVCTVCIPTNLTVHPLYLQYISITVKTASNCMSWAVLIPNSYLKTNSSINQSFYLVKRPNFSVSNNKDEEYRRLTTIHTLYLLNLLFISTIQQAMLAKDLSYFCA